MPSVSKTLQFFLQMDKANAIVSRKFSGRAVGFNDLAILIALSGAPDNKMRRIDLAEQLGLTPSGVTRMLLPMEKIGLIKREANARDARVSYVMLTPSGKRVLDESRELAEEVCEELVPKDKEKKLGEMIEVLKSIG